MIRLFISDIDGCLATPFEAYRLDRWQTLADRVRRGSAENDAWPAVTVCSGRPLPYVEAVTQALGLRQPALFESGAGIFSLPEGEVIWNPGFTTEMARAVKEIRSWMAETCIPGTKLSLDYSKRTQAGLIGPDPAEIDRLIPLVEEYVASRYSNVRVFHTSISIDVVPDTITKRQALEWLAQETDISLDEMAFIGDTGGDVGALEAVGHSFAPQNAEELVRNRVSQVTDGSEIDAVLEALSWCVEQNNVRA